VAIPQRPATEPDPYRLPDLAAAPVVFYFWPGTGRRPRSSFESYKRIDLAEGGR
jgi:hypothetical protein